MWCDLHGTVSQVRYRAEAPRVVQRVISHAAILKEIHGLISFKNTRHHGLASEQPTKGEMRPELP